MNTVLVNALHIIMIHFSLPIVFKFTVTVNATFIKLLYHLHDLQTHSYILYMSELLMFFYYVLFCDKLFQDYTKLLAASPVSICNLYILLLYNITSHFMTVLMKTYIEHQEKIVLTLVLVLYNGYGCYLCMSIYNITKENVHLICRVHPITTDCQNIVAI